MVTLAKKAYGSAKNEVEEGAKEVKELKQNKQRQYKTWGRVKQDFKEWYDGLKNEFNRKASTGTKEETREIEQGKIEISTTETD